jgi:hypothetical protein
LVEREHIGKVQRGSMIGDAYLLRAAGQARKVLDPEAIFTVQGGSDPALMAWAAICRA